MAILSCEKAKEQEEEATVLLLPPGFTFRPTDIELLTYYLYKKIHGDQDLPNMIVERKLYGKEAPEPWKIFDEGSTTTAVEEVKYFYTWAIKKHGSKKNYFDRVCGQGKWKMDKTDPILDSENRLLGFKKLFSFDNFDKDKYGSWVLWEYTLNTNNPNNQQELTVCKMHRGTIGKKKAKQDRELMNMPCNKKRTRITMNESVEPASRSSSTKMLKQTTNKESSLPAPSTPLVIEKPMVLQYGGLSFPSTTFGEKTAELTFGDVDLMQQDYQNDNCFWTSHQGSQPCITDNNYDSLLQQESAPTSWTPATVQTSVNSSPVDSNYSCISAAFEVERTTSPAKFNTGGTSTLPIFGESLLSQQDGESQCSWQMSHQEIHPHPQLPPSTDNYDCLLQQHLQLNESCQDESLSALLAEAIMATSDPANINNNLSNYCECSHFQPEPQPREQLCTNNDETTSCSGRPSVNSPMQIDVYQPQPDQGVPATCPQPDDDNQCVYGACTQSDDQPIAQSDQDVPADECAFGVEDLSYLDNPEFLSELQNVVGDDVDDTAQEEDGLNEFFGELSSTR
ncbi:hypothetical protein FRX31_006207 [Thalictrum thalictroides]|uniref:NAC domain-containing protein n=1 Tax=Thalictrum thalictroides TaxID=46969 RepID=A0A7J6X5U2_THATH|nr:hypothetical protein FRX31_006207 [Thalictrum thalictroides]